MQRISAEDVSVVVQWAVHHHIVINISIKLFQIGRFNRAAGPTGRFRLQLINKCVKAETSYKDSSVSPVIR